MIRIVGKGYKHLLRQLNDFLGISQTIFISLKSAEGRKKYEKLFGRKLVDKKANPTIRIISITQSFLTDFIDDLFEKSKSIVLISDCFLNRDSKFKVIFLKDVKVDKKEIKC